MGSGITVPENSGRLTLYPTTFLFTHACAYEHVSKPDDDPDDAGKCPGTPPCIVESRKKFFLLGGGTG